MIKEKISQWLEVNEGLANEGDIDWLVDVVERCFKDLHGWVSVDDLKLETPCLLLTESGQVVTGWKRECEGDIYFCYGNEYASWDFDYNFDIGRATHFKPLPPSEGKK